MRKILIVVDMQKDFIDGSLGTPEAEAIVEPVIAKIKTYAPEDVYATRDTHPKNYLETREGHHLPVAHCIAGTPGWQLHPKVAELIPADHVIDKPTFGSLNLMNAMVVARAQGEIEIELVGLCTDICVVSNALLIKAALPEVPVAVDARCCAGVTPAKHAAALETMASCQIEIRR
jgi:nicotinamidase/pyrazinamidase